MNNHKNIPNLSGKVAIVTGANSGTGYGITYHLAKNNCKVIMASRNKNKLEDARKKLLDEIPNADLEIEVLELTSLKNIQAFTERIKKKYERIDYLANNAGGGGNYKRTVDNLEENLTVNYLGHFAVTTQLLPVLKDGSRIVTFSSIGYKRFLKNDLDVDNLMCENEVDYNQMQEYCKAKLCSILFGVKLQSEFERIGSKSLALSCHPGWARTDLMTKSTNPFPLRMLGKVMNAVSGAIGISQNLYDGALPAIEALVSDQPQPNMVYSPKKRESTGEPIPLPIDKTHYQDEDIDKLWVKTQELLKLTVSDYL